jgi:hypothetical protein
MVSFLTGVGNIVEVRQALMTRGYTDAVHQQGWKLLETVSGRTSLVPPPVAGKSTSDNEAAAAVTKASHEIDAWVSPNFSILKAAKGSEGVLAVQTFLSRVEALGTPQRAAFAATDREALALLEARGITVAERTRVRRLLDVVQKGAVSSTGESNVPKTESTKSHEAKLALYAWHREWSSITRAVVKRRDYLIRMDLATRAKPKAKTP